LLKKAVEQINFEIGQIDRLFEEYADLLKQARHKKPTLVELTAMASVLHSFYSGLENIFLSVAKGIDKDIPSGEGWHRKLLRQIAEAAPNRKPLLSAEVFQQLIEYLGFRHFYRHSYSFFLEWERLELLVSPLPEIWKQTKNEIQQFLKQIEAE
jgi:hypothetical protein